MSAGGKFQPGQSGNPAGKAKGTRNATTLVLEALLDGEAAALTRKAIELAQDGDTVALRLCLDRLLPPARIGRSASICRRSTPPTTCRWPRVPSLPQWLLAS
jgi:hypothetical protein